MFATSQFEKTTPHRAIDVQNGIIILSVVMSLFVGSGPET